MRHGDAGAGNLLRHENRYAYSTRLGTAKWFPKPCGGVAQPWNKDCAGCLRSRERGQGEVTLHRVSVQGISGPSGSPKLRYKRERFKRHSIYSWDRGNGFERRLSLLGQRGNGGITTIKTSRHMMVTSQ